MTSSDNIDLDGERGDACYVFSLFDDNEFDAIDEDDIELCEEDWRTCPECDTKMQSMKSFYICANCSYKKQIFNQGDEYNTSIQDNYNTNKWCPISIKIVGPGSYKYNKAFLKTSDYRKTQSNHTQKEMSRFNAQTKEGKLPIIILKEAADLYGQIQRHHIVRRGNGRKGALGACIYFVCCMHNITKKPKEIAAFLDIEESYLSTGDKLLRELHSDNVIDIPIYYDPTESYTTQYFELLSIDNKYFQFIIDLIKETSNVNMVGENNSRISTKCAGAIYTLMLQENLNFTKNDIVQNCKISKSTFIRYHDFIVLNRKLLKHIFKMHGIKTPKKKKK